MLTIKNIEDQILSRIYFNVITPQMINTILFHDCGDLYQITIHSSPPSINESNQWECQSARMDIFEAGKMKEFAYIFDLSILSEFYNMLASSPVTREQIFKLN